MSAVLTNPNAYQGTTSNVAMPDVLSTNSNDLGVELMAQIDAKHAQAVKDAMHESTKWYLYIAIIFAGIAILLLLNKG